MLALDVLRFRCDVGRGRIRVPRDGRYSWKMSAGEGGSARPRKIKQSCLGEKSRDATAGEADEGLGEVRKACSRSWRWLGKHLVDRIPPYFFSAVSTSRFIFLKPPARRGLGPGETGAKPEGKGED